MTRGSRITYSDEEMEWLEANRSMIISDYFAAFFVKFSRADVTSANLHALRKRKRWLVGRAPGRFKGRQVGRYKIFTTAEADWLRDNCTLEISEYHRQFCEAFNRTNISADQIHSLRKHKGWRTGRSGHFQKGRANPNKGKTNPIAASHPNCKRNHFKKGQLPHNTKFLGHERLHDDGYVLISVNEKNPHTGGERRYVLKHLWLWQEKNGPLPEGKVLKCLDGNKQNTDPSNWEPISRGVLARINGSPATTTIPYDSAPDELKPAILTAAKLAQRAKDVRKERQA